MATIVAAAGGGNWTTGGTWVGGVAPTAADDAQLSGSSGNVTINSGAVCRSLDCTGYTGTLTHTAAVTLAIGDATAGAGNVALKLSAGMTYTLGSATTSVLSFISTSATQQTITSAGKTLGNWTVNGVGSSYILSDSNTVGATSTVTLTAGTLNTGNQTCNWGLFSGTGAITRSLQLGSSVITVSGTGSAWDLNIVTNLTFNAGTSSITASGNNISFFAGPNLSYYSVSLTGSGGSGNYLFRPNNTSFVNFSRIGTASKTDELGMTATAIVTGTLTLQGNSATNRLFVNSNSNGSTRTWTITGATVVASNADFRDMSFSVATDLSAISGGSGDVLGNTNITFTPSVSRYAVAAGNWSSTSMWSATSGGSAGATVPLPQDDVFLDASSAAGTYTCDMPRSGRNFDTTGFTRTLQLSGNNLFTGSVMLPATGTFLSGSTLILAGRSSLTFTTNARTLSAVTIDCFGGTYTLQDDLTVTGLFNLNTGGVVTNNKTVSTGTVTATSNLTRSLNMGQSTWNLTSTAGTTVWNATSSNLTFSGSQATIVISTTSTNTRTFTGGGLTYGTLNYTLAGSTGVLVIGGSNTFSTINFSDASNARTLTFTAATTTTITTAFNVTGTASNLITINSSSAASTATLSKASGIVSCNYLSIRDSTATGGATWYAGGNSTSVSNNSGWLFVSYARQTGFLAFFE